MLFMLAKPTEARIIRPLLSFYRVSNLPVYTTSKVYSGKPNPSLDRDLSGIVFCGDSSQFDQSILEMQQEIAAQYQVATRNIPLFNLGYDTYALISELSTLQQNPARRMSGKTGTLWLGSNNNIRRQLTCGKFKDGLVQKLGLGPILKADRNIDEDHLHQQQAEPHQQNSHSHGAYKKSWLERSQLIPE
jgi:outer membrane PBP1 activator LpoA protein